MFARHLRGWTHIALVCVAIVGIGEASALAGAEGETSPEPPAGQAETPTAAEGKTRATAFEIFLTDRLKSTEAELKEAKEANNAALAPDRKEMFRWTLEALVAIVVVWSFRSGWETRDSQLNAKATKDAEKAKLQLALAAIEATAKIECARLASDAKAAEQQAAKTLQELLAVRHPRLMRALNQSITGLGGSVDTFGQKLLAGLKSVFGRPATSTPTPGPDPTTKDLKSKDQTG